MTDQEGAVFVENLAKLYPRMALKPGNAAAYIRQLAFLPGAKAPLVLDYLSRTAKSFPSVAEIFEAFDTVKLVREPDAIRPKHTPCKGTGTIRIQVDRGGKLASEIVRCACRAGKAMALPGSAWEKVRDYGQVFGRDPLETPDEPEQRTPEVAAYFRAAIKRQLSNVNAGLPANEGLPKLLEPDAIRVMALRHDRGGLQVAFRALGATYRGPQDARWGEPVVAGVEAFEEAVW